MVLYSCADGTIRVSRDSAQGIVSTTEESKHKLTLPLNGALHVHIVDITQDGQFVILLESAQPVHGIRERGIGPGSISKGLGNGIGKRGNAELVRQPCCRRY